MQTYLSILLSATSNQRLKCLSIFTKFCSGFFYSKLSSNREFRENRLG
jgi:hypothetical protein